MAKVPKYTDVVKELGNQGGEAEMAWDVGILLTFSICFMRFFFRFSCLAIKNIELEV
jgi:hypothetical protein